MNSTPPKGISTLVMISMLLLISLQLTFMGYRRIYSQIYYVRLLQRYYSAYWQQQGALQCFLALHQQDASNVLPQTNTDICNAKFDVQPIPRSRQDLTRPPASQPPHSIKYRHQPHPIEPHPVQVYRIQVTPLTTQPPLLHRYVQTQQQPDKSYQLAWMIGGWYDN